MKTCILVSIFTFFILNSTVFAQGNTTGTGNGINFKSKDKDANALSIQFGVNIFSENKEQLKYFLKDLKAKGPKAAELVRQALQGKGVQYVVLSGIDVGVQSPNCNSENTCVYELTSGKRPGTPLVSITNGKLEINAECNYFEPISDFILAGNGHNSCSTMGVLDLVDALNSLKAK